jgi:hypothetical protein
MRPTKGLSCSDAEQVGEAEVEGFGVAVTEAEAGKLEQRMAGSPVKGSKRERQQKESHQGNNHLFLPKLTPCN